MEQTLVLIKPDAVERNLIGRIISIYEVNGLIVKEMKMIQASREIVEEHYCEHREKPFFNSVVDYITRGPLVALVLEGSNAISNVREINGPTKPKIINPNTIRGKYGLNVEENCVHASDSPESANREIKLWFGK